MICFNVSIATMVVRILETTANMQTVSAVSVEVFAVVFPPVEQIEH
jgi:hypothetical protein